MTIFFVNPIARRIPRSKIRSWTAAADVWAILRTADASEMLTTRYPTGLVVAMIAAIYPAIVASRMMPADALRTEV